MADEMPESLHGAEGEILDLVFELSTAKQWANLLKAPLERAMSQGDEDFALRLVGAGAKIGNGIHAAVTGEDREMGFNMILAGASPNARDAAGRTPLHVAAEWGETAMVELLLKSGAKKDVLDMGKRTPLFLAASRGRLSASRALMAAGAKVNIFYGEDHRTVVHIAVDRGHADILTAAIKHGADVNVKDTNDNTPLHLAAISNNLGTDAVLILSKNGADINARDDNGETPLFRAACMAGTQGIADMVDLLLRSGADETIEDADGRAALGVVEELIPRENDPIILADIEHVRLLLANAPADRAWRRRGYLTMCRAFPERVQQGYGSVLARVLELDADELFKKVMGYL